MKKYIARCHMTLHDNLYYASHEFGRFYETEKYLHNYGLTYALGLVQPAPSYFTNLQVPQYQIELTKERVGGCYVTPAHPLHANFVFVTFKMATIPYYSNSLPESKNKVLYGRAKELAPGSKFEFFVFAEEPKVLPHWIRLGKWMTKAEVMHKWYEIGKEAKVQEAKNPVTVACPINPLDIARTRLSTFDLVVMPPSSLLTNPRVVGQYCSLPKETLFGDRQNDEVYIPMQMSYLEGETLL